ncbi:patatin-like protein [Novosphingobium sp. YJ-S2-02]|uniref:Patatin-like protein n=1 Tax=Novosphingobium aureum TaxID=2792964 RepID=A0A931HBZ5_9SPHN|nr:patatin-like protein [Novosphingobium aureum]MBH0113161.1 patatin-like protein [Novosphingobium aureum]
MRQKELRIALVCYGGVSLAVYMHGVTKELWKALRASQALWSGDSPPEGATGVYWALLRRLEVEGNLRLRIIADSIAGASAGGINSVFLAQAIHSGQSLEPLTDLWLECADIDVLLDPDARPWSAATKFWARPLVSYLLHRPDNVVTASVAPETRAEVREKLSRLIRSRWFEPPFSGPHFSGLLARALEAMAAAPLGRPLLPAGHPLDLFVTTTDFKGHPETLRLHSPRRVLENEHRLTIDFHATTPSEPGRGLAPLPELVLAARATASFPGAFPAMQLAEIDAMAHERGHAWPGRDEFLHRVMPEHMARGDIASVSLIDGSVLVNAPFADAMSVLRNRPAAREVDRRVVYIDPTPATLLGGTTPAQVEPANDGDKADKARPARGPGFFSVIFGSLSSIPREQPIRDNLEAIEAHSREIATLRGIVIALRPEIEETVEKLFGHTLFLDHPTPKRLAAWRAKAQRAAIEQAGFAYHGYAQVKFSSLLEGLARTVIEAAPEALAGHSVEATARFLAGHLFATDLKQPDALRGAGSAELIQFLRDHDLSFRIRRLRFLTRRVTQDWEADDSVSETDRDTAREAFYGAISLYRERESATALGTRFPEIAANLFTQPGAVIEAIARQRRLADVDARVDTIMAEAMAAMPPTLRRRILLAYLGFPFYDTATLPLLRGEGLNEFDPIRVDRVSPEDCNAIRTGGAAHTLRGTEFYTFGAFFSRAYRENDYLWGRLHGAERIIDLIVSTLPAGHEMPASEIRNVRMAAFLAILDEEEDRLDADPYLVRRIRDEVMRAAQKTGPLDDEAGL